MRIALATAEDGVASSLTLLERAGSEG